MSFEHTVVASSWVTEVWFDGDLVIAFRNGDIARFPGTNIGMYYALILSGSPGTFVNLVLKGWPYMKCGRPIAPVAMAGPLPCDPTLTDLPLFMRVELTFGTITKRLLIRGNGSGAWNEDFSVLSPYLVCDDFRIFSLGLACFGPGRITFNITAGVGDLQSNIPIGILEPFHADFGVVGNVSACGQTDTDVSIVVDGIY